jgi:photosystem II stability/assembly factor-like uncharacterized protein
MSYIFRLLFVLVCFISIENSLQAQWKQTKSPEGGYIFCFASSGSKIYVGTVSGGVYVSTNGGTNWTQANNGLGNITVGALAVNSTNLIASASNDGRSKIYLSTNDGTNWTKVDNGLPNDNPNVYFQIRCLAVAPDGKGDVFIYAGTNGYGVYVSSDNGTNWVPDTAGLNNKNIMSLTANDTTIYVGTSTGVFRSTINTKSWTPCAPNDLGYFDCKSIVVLDSSVFISGDAFVGGEGYIYRSTNKGENWTKIKTMNNNIGYMATLDTNIYVGNYDGTILRSNDRGNTWSASNLPMENVSIISIAAIDTNLFAGTFGGGVFVSTDRGMSWNAMNAGLKNPKVNALVIKDSSIFAGTETVGVFRSNNMGESWSQVNTGLEPIVAIPGNTISLSVTGLAATDTNLFASVAGGGIFKLSEDGNSWSPVVTGSDTADFAAISSLAAKDTILFAGTLTVGIYRSTDNGTSWTLSNTGLTQTSVNALAASDSNLFTGTTQGVFRSNNNGTNWFAAGLGNHIVEELAMNETNLYAKTYDGGMFVSTNYGLSWKEFDSEESAGINILSLAADKLNLYAGSNLGIIYKPVSEITSVNYSNIASPSAFKLFQNYPNPFNPTTIISYELPAASHVTLKLYDVIGREIKTLLDERQLTGIHSVKFNASNLASGIYFYSITAGTFHQARKMVFIK